MEKLVRAYQAVALLKSGDTLITAVMSATDYRSYWLSPYNSALNRSMLLLT